MKIQAKQTVKNSLKNKLMFIALSASIVLSAAFFLVDVYSVKEETVSAPLRENKKQISFLDEDVVENVKFIDARPLISFDGKQIFFGRRKSKENIGGEKDFQDIWFAKVDESGKLGRSQNLGSVINNGSGNGICSISPDGNEIIITNEYNKIKNSPIARSRQINGQWSKPEQIFIDDYHNYSQYEDFYLHYQEDVLFMAVDRKDGRGDQDLYVSLPDQNGNWAKPINLGPAINTAFAEFAPYLAADGKTLFFASNKKGGFGGSDIYVSQRLDDSWTNWSAPVNLGPTINSENEESYVSVSSNFESIYIESFAKNSTERQIFVIKLPGEFHPLNIVRNENLVVKNN